MHDNLDSMMATISPANKNHSLLQALLFHHLINNEQLETISNTIIDQRLLIPHLISQYQISADEIAHACANFFELDYQNLSDITPQQLPLEELPISFIKNNHILPLQKMEKALKVAIYSPAALEPIEKIQFQTGFKIIPVISNYHQLINLINAALSQREYSTSTLEQTNETPAKSLIEQLINDAIHRNASDIHLEIYQDLCRVRMRIDGLLHEITKPPTYLFPSLISRLKIMSDLDIAEKRLPQDGRFHFQTFNGKIRDCRISTCPTLHGEKSVIRILEPDKKRLQINDLGLDIHEQEILKKALHKSQGLIIVTGPTGSGKTVTLYTALQLLNAEIHNILTIEDPVEIQLSGINQVHVHQQAGLTCAKALRSFLRQDPDIIMVGEIRDHETAEIAINAAQTGHLVLTTLHTNSAAETLTRLINMGIEPFNLAGSVILIMAQRLVRKLCEYCKTIYHPSQDILRSVGFETENVAPLKIYQAHACEHCTKGYHGRVGIFEVMPISPALTDIILAQGNANQLAIQAQHEGMKNLWQSGLKKVAQGITSLEEIYRVAG